VLTVACVYKPGGGFSDEYAYKLKQNVEEKLDTPHRFVALTRQKLKGIETIPLQKNRIGYWNKLELFRKGLFDGPVVYLDLDTIVVRDFTEIANFPHDFTAADNWKGSPGESLSSWFLAFDGRVDRSHILESFDPSMAGEYERDWRFWGDQGHIERSLNEEWFSLRELFPGCCESYKWSVQRNKRISQDTVFVVFHGRPRPHELNWRLPYGVD